VKAIRIGSKYVLSRLEKIEKDLEELRESIGQRTEALEEEMEEFKASVEA
jgi:prephenate dehydrogenase